MYKTEETLVQNIPMQTCTEYMNKHYTHYKRYIHVYATRYKLVMCTNATNLCMLHVVRVQNVPAKACVHMYVQMYKVQYVTHAET